MRPFKSVGQALGFYYRQAIQRRAASGVDFRPRVQGLDSRGRRDDIAAIFLSIDLCLAILGAEERLNLAERFMYPDRRPDQGGIRVYHRAMVKLGKEMRRRGVVG